MEGTFNTLFNDSMPLEYEVTEALAQQFEEIGEIGYFVFDALEEKFLFISPGFARIYGVNPITHRESIKSLDDDLAFILEEDRQQVHAAYQKYLCKGENCVVQYRIRRGDGAIRWLRESSSAQRVKDGKVERTIGAILDITLQKETESELLRVQHALEQVVFERTADLSNTINKLESEVAERKKMAAELEFLANHDPLTGLPSLRLCKERLENAIANSQQRSSRFALMFLDLDGFKVVNDKHGHELGDQVLQVTANRIVSEIPETDILARIGGDEFVLILEDVDSRKSISKIGDRLISKTSQPLWLGDRQVSVSVSIGIAVFPEDGITPKELMSQADKAMYRVKNNGKNNYSFSTNL